MAGHRTDLVERRDCVYSYKVIAVFALIIERVNLVALVSNSEDQLLKLFYELG